MSLLPLNVRRYQPLLAATCLSMCFGVAHASLLIYPSTAVLGLSDSCLQRASAELSADAAETTAVSVTGAVIDCDFMDAMQQAGFLNQIQQAFIAKIKQDFPSAYTDQVNAANKGRTFILSLEVVRASRYVVKKESTAEVFLPVTVALKLTNILTGEVIYAQNLTQIKPIKLLVSDLQASTTQAQVMVEYRTLFKALMSGLLVQLKSELNLAQIEVPVVTQWKSYLILAKGTEQNIGVGDELSASDGSLIRVVSASSQQSVAIPILMDASAKPRLFVKNVRSTSKAVNKPKVLIADILSRPEQSKDLIETVFASALGDQAAFSLTPVNRRYGQLAAALSQETQLAQREDTQQRSLPDLFIRLVVLPNVSYSQSIGSMTEIQVLQTRVMGELIDSSGRVLFAAIGVDKKEDKVSTGMGFTLQDRQEVSLKNALLDLAGQFVKNVQFEKISLGVRQIQGNQAVIADPDQRLSRGMSVKLYRPYKSGQANTVIPIWDAQVVKKDAGLAYLDLVLPVLDVGKDTLQPEAGDVVLLNAVGTAAPLDTALGFCTNTAAAALGPVVFDAAKTLAYFSLATQATRPLYATAGSTEGQQPLAAAVQALTENAGFRSTLQPKFVIPPTNCIQPVYLVKQQSEACTTPKQCNFEYQVVAGVRPIGADGKPGNPVGFSQTIQIQSVSRDNLDAVLQQHLFDAVPALLQKVSLSPTFSPTR